MTVEIKREGWIELFTQMRRPTMFLSRFFTIKRGGIYNGEKVAIDIQRYGEKVAIAVTKCTGPNLNDFDEFTTKEFTPPAYDEAFPLDVCDLLNRMAGVDPYTAAYMEYASQLMAKMAQGFVLIGDKVSRAVELQASQIFQTGMLVLTDENGDTRYILDFKPKATHFPTVGVSWSDLTNSDPIGDIQSISDVIRKDGKVDSNLLVMGTGALRNFIGNDKVKSNLDNRRIDMGAIRPEMRDSGATFYGFVWVGSYIFEIWTYPEYYEDAQTGDLVRYIEDDKVVVLSDRTRLDMTSARVPAAIQDPRVANLVPPRISSVEGGFDVTPNVYTTPNGKQITGELESRPLLVPVQIDGYGCLDTEI
jgi:hypothetical protein